MNIEGYIKTFILENKYLILTGIGELRLEYQPAQEDAADYIIQPPSYTIRFYPEVKQDDGALSQFIANQSDISIEDANKEVADYFEEKSSDLYQNQRVTIDDLGDVYLSGEEMQFSPATKEPFFLETFGMEPISYEGITTSQPQATEQTDQNHRKMKQSNANGKSGQQELKKIWLPVILTIIIVLLGVLFYYQYQVREKEDVILYEQQQEKTPQQPDVETKKQKDEEQRQKQDKPKQKSEAYIEKQLKEQAQKERALSMNDSKTESGQNKSSASTASNAASNAPKKYYLIVGSFSNRENAKSFQNKLADQGYSPKIFKSNEAYYRVYTSAFSSQQKAMDQLLQLRDQEGEDFAWLLEKDQ